MKVFLADDHTIFLESLSMLLSTIEKMEIVGAAKDPLEVLQKIADSEAEILICDYYMPLMNGAELAFRLRENHPTLKILMLSSCEEPKGIKSAIQAGVKGFVSKRINRDELQKALTTIAEGYTYYSELVVKILAADDSEPPVFQNGALSVREIEIIKLIAGEMTGTDIAEKLSLSPHTIATHRKNIFHKLGVNSTYALIKYAIEHRLI